MDIVLIYKKKLVKLNKVQDLRQCNNVFFPFFDAVKEVLSETTDEASFFSPIFVLTLNKKRCIIEVKNKAAL